MTEVRQTRVDRWALIVHRRTGYVSRASSDIEHLNTNDPAFEKVEVVPVGRPREALVEAPVEES